MDKLKLIVLQLILFTQFSACQKMNNNTYDWIPTIGAPEAYPVKILKGQFVSNGGYSPDLPASAFVNMGWGESGGVMAVGPDQKPVPDSLNVTWLSYAENKYYKGSFVLPKEKITKLFEEGYIDHEENKKVTYYYLTLGFTPHGGITLWLTGAKQQVEVATFKATETTPDAGQIRKEEQVYLDPAFVKERYEEGVTENLRTQAKTDNFSPAFWELALKKYNWNFAGQDKLSPFYELNADYVNAEREHLSGEALSYNEPKERAIPKTVYLYWQDDKKQMMISEIHFDAEETSKVFSGIKSGEKATLHFEVDRKSYGVTVLLAVADRQIPLKKIGGKTEIRNN